MTDQPATETGRATQSTLSRLLTAGRISRYEYDAIEQQAAAIAETRERRRVVEQVRPFFEKLADTLDRSEAKPGGRFADMLRETWREMHDAILDDEVTTP